MKTKSCYLLLFTAVAMIVSLACLTGCGSSGETSSAETRSPAEKVRAPEEKALPPKPSPAEKARFLKRANAICRRADAEQHRLATRYLKRGPVAVKWELIDPAVVPAMEKELRELRALNPPGGDEAEIRRILVEMEKGIKDADYDPIDLVYTWSDPFTAMRGLARRYGLTVCALSSQAVIQPRVEE